MKKEKKSNVLRPRGVCTNDADWDAFREVCGTAGINTSMGFRILISKVVSGEIKFIAPTLRLSAHPIPVERPKMASDDNGGHPEGTGDQQ